MYNELWQLDQYGTVKYDDFTKDIVPVELPYDDEHFADELTLQQRAIAWAEYEHQMQLQENEINF